MKHHLVLLSFVTFSSTVLAQGQLEDRPTVPVNIGQYELLRLSSHFGPDRGELAPSLDAAAWPIDRSRPFPGVEAIQAKIGEWADDPENQRLAAQAVLACKLSFAAYRLVNLNVRGVGTFASALVDMERQGRENLIFSILQDRSRDEYVRMLDPKAISDYHSRERSGANRFEDMMSSNVSRGTGIDRTERNPGVTGRARPEDPTSGIEREAFRDKVRDPNGQLSSGIERESAREMVRDPNDRLSSHLATTQRELDRPAKQDRPRKDPSTRERPDPAATGAMLESMSRNAEKIHEFNHDLYRDMQRMEKIFDKDGSSSRGHNSALTHGGSGSSPIAKAGSSGRSNNGGSGGKSGGSGGKATSSGGKGSGSGGKSGHVSGRRM